MSGEYDGKNGNRDFLGEGGEGKGGGIAWDSIQISLCRRETLAKVSWRIAALGCPHGI
jgi:hypothetical protein